RALLDEKQGDDSREDGARCDDFPAEMPIAAVCTQKLIDQRRHEESANAGAAEDEADGAAAVAFEPSGGGGAARNDVSEADADSIDHAEAEKKFPRFRGSERQKQRTGANERR